MLDIYNMILALGVKIKVSLLYASHQGLSWGGEVDNWTERKSVGMDNELGYSLPSPTI